MSCLAVDEHNTIENDGDVEFEEVMPVVRPFDRCGGEGSPHQRTIDPCSVSPLVPVDILLD